MHRACKKIYSCSQSTATVDRSIKKLARIVRRFFKKYIFLFTEHSDCGWEYRRITRVDACITWLCWPLLKYGVQCPARVSWQVPLCLSRHCAARFWWTSCYFGNVGQRWRYQQISKVCIYIFSILISDLFFNLKSVRNVEIKKICFLFVFLQLNSFFL